MAAELRMSKEHFEEMLAHVRSVYPLEGCGLLAAEAGRVQRVYPVDNALQSPTEYEMDPGQQLRAMLDIEERGWEMGGIFHSHPMGPQHPSATDIERAYYPDSIHVIISLARLERPAVNAFTIVGGRVEDADISIEQLS